MFSKFWWFTMALLCTVVLLTSAAPADDDSSSNSSESKEDNKSSCAPEVATTSAPEPEPPATEAPSPPSVTDNELNSSRNDTTPKLEYRPVPQVPGINTSLIWLKGTEEVNYRSWTNQLDLFITPYLMTPNENIINCDYDNYPKTGEVCKVDVQNWYPCISNNNYDYHKSAPCVFLKLNNICNWIPEFYNDSSILPKEMPMKLKEHIHNIVNPKERNTVWVSCEGESPADKENVGPIEYFPKWGFPGYFYPYKNVEGYLSPLVAVHFASPQKGVIINIECKVWAKNIIQNKQERLGYVYFELLID